jgi:N-ethylmaleimide reductase
MSLLFSKTTLGPLPLQNHLVMCPLTRSRAIGNVPNDLMVEYYTQRASAGLIITEGTSPLPVQRPRATSWLRFRGFEPKA